MISKLKINFIQREKGKDFFFNNSKRIMVFILTTSILIGCASSKIVVNPSIQTTLKSIGTSPDSAGTLIYEGAVFPIVGSNLKQIFSYERRVKEEKEILSATHITRDMEKNTIVTQTARYNAKKELREFEYINGQVGYIAKAEIVGKLIRFKLTDNSGQVTSSEEEVNEPLAVGPS